MTQAPGQPANQTLTFGGPEQVQEALPAALPPPLGRRSASANRNAARRARQRRRAAQRRSRVRMREGSEVMLAFLILIGLTLLLIDLRTDGSAFAGARSLGAAAIGPLQAGVADVVDPADADAVLVGENERLQSELAAQAGDRSRLAELEGLLGIVGRSSQRVVAAAVVALDSGAGSALTATIDRGSDAGLAVDQAVLASGGLAGRVQSVAPATAVVRLTADPGFVVGARLAGSGQAGIIRGTGEPDRLTMDLLDPLVEVPLGESVVTYGSPGTGPFPPGLAIGTVTDAGDPANPRRVLQVRPTAPLTAVSVVAVVVMEAQQPPPAKVAR